MHTPQAGGDLDLLLSLIRGATNKSTVKDLLRTFDLTISGTWDELTERLRNAVVEDTIPYRALVDLLDDVEQAGHQHVFLFELTDEARTLLADPNEVRQRVVDADLGHVLNTTTELVNRPDDPTCVKVVSREDEFSTKWVEERTWRDKIDETQEDGIYTVRYEIKHGRAVNLFKADLADGTAELRISDVGKVGHSEYEEKRDEYGARLSWLLDLRAQTLLPLWRAIPRIVHSEEARTRAHHYHTPEGTKAAFKSSSTDYDLTRDEVYQAGDEAVGDHADPRYLNAYWLPAHDNPLSDEVHTYIYADNRGNKVRFSTNCEEEEVRYVLGRIRHYAG